MENDVINHFTNKNSNFHKALEGIMQLDGKFPSLLHEYMCLQKYQPYPSSLSFGLICGLASIWEFKVRILGEKLKVENYERENKNKKNTNMEAVQYRKLEDVIKDIQSKTDNRLDINLSNLNKLRGCLIHGNFQQLRIYCNNSSRIFKNSHKGNVIKIPVSENLDPGEIENLSDPMSANKAETESIISFFTEISQSGLLLEIWRNFEKCFIKIKNLITLKSYSFQIPTEGSYKCDFSGFFEQIVLQGKKIDPQDEKKFIEYVNRENYPEVSDDFFKKIYSYLNI